MWLKFAVDRGIGLFLYVGVCGGGLARGAWGEGFWFWGKAGGVGAWVGALVGALVGFTSGDGVIDDGIEVRDGDGGIEGDIGAFRGLGRGTRIEEACGAEVIEGEGGLCDGWGRGGSRG